MPECLFTENDWLVWEEIDKRKKGRSINFKSGQSSNNYYYGKCVFCGKRIVSYLIIKHLEREHKDKFWTWKELSKIRDECEIKQ